MYLYEFLTSKTTVLRPLIFFKVTHRMYTQRRVVQILWFLLEILVSCNVGI